MHIVGIDVGGTFTDFVWLDAARGTLTTAKFPSTPADQSIGLLYGLEALGVPLADLQVIVHGTTVATNAVLERRGAVCGLLTTRGFRDILELRRRDRPDTYGLQGTFEPLIPRHQRLEVTERTDYRGTILQPLDEQEVAARAQELLAEGVEAVVVSFLHAYANPTNEQRARQVLETVWPNAYIVTASEVLPEFREFERTSTAVVNAYVQPLIDRYLRSLAQQLRQKGYRRELLLIQSNGGVMSLEVSRRFSVNTVLSGPAAGVIAARAIAEQAGFANVITCDMGGTSLDIALVAAGQPATTSEINLAYGIPIRVPMLDITTVGAGGGSIAWIDRGGYLQIGPQSAGADPGRLAMAVAAVSQQSRTPIWYWGGSMPPRPSAVSVPGTSSWPAPSRPSTRALAAPLACRLWKRHRRLLPWPTPRSLAASAASRSNAAMTHAILCLLPLAAPGHCTPVRCCVS